MGALLCVPEVFLILKVPPAFLPVKGAAILQPTEVPEALLRVKVEVPPAFLPVKGAAIL
jgi:hypothetical protein